MSQDYDQEAQLHAHYLSRNQQFKPESFPPFIRGERLLQCFAWGDFLRFRAKDGEFVTDIYRKVWHDAAVVLSKSTRASKKDDDKNGSSSPIDVDESIVPTVEVVETDEEQLLDGDGESNCNSEDNSPVNFHWIDLQSVTTAEKHLDDVSRFNSHDNEAVVLWLKKTKEHACKPLRMATLASAQRVQDMIDLYPNLQPAAQCVAGAIRLRAEKNLPVRLPRLLLQGEPGSGKTEFVRAVADVLSLPLIAITLSAAYGAFELPGGHRTWRDALPGRLFQGMLTSPVANPLFLFDEAERSMPLVQSSLLQWLEDRYFRDQYLELDFQVDQVSSVLITNSLVTLDTAVQSRCRMFDVATLSNDQKAEIVRRIYLRLLSCEEFADFLPSLSSAIVERLLTQSLRSARMMLESALYNAALHQRRTLVETDLQLPDVAATGFGFLRK